MRDLLRYILIAVLVVVVGWFLIGELKEWTIVDNSVTVESDAGWELLYTYSNNIDDGSYLDSSFVFDFKDYDVFCVNIIVDSLGFEGIYNSHFFTLDESFINFTTTDAYFVNYTYNLSLSISGNIGLFANVVSESEYCAFNFSLKIWGVK